MKNICGLSVIFVGLGENGDVCGIHLNPVMCYLGSSLASDNLASIRMAVERWRVPKLQPHQKFKKYKASFEPHKERGRAYRKPSDLLIVLQTYPTAYLTNVNVHVRGLLEQPHALKHCKCDGGRTNEDV